jgi:hypothetical protein
MKMYLAAIIVIVSAIFIASCGGAETKVDTNKTIKTEDTAQTDERPADPVTVPKTEPRSGSADKTVGSEKNDILANIDKHLVSTISGDNLTVENTLPDAKFDRAIVEVSELSGDGSLQKPNFYTVINIEPHGKKSVKLTGINSGAKMQAHVVKAKSTQLTNGEMILVGSRYSPK